jgi:hypothetical protein
MTFAISLFEKLIGRQNYGQGARNDPVRGRIPSTPLSLTDRARNHFNVRLNAQQAGQLQ